MPPCSSSPGSSEVDSLELTLHVPFPIPCDSPSQAQREVALIQDALLARYGFVPRHLVAVNQTQTAASFSAYRLVVTVLTQDITERACAALLRTQ